jgi:hypothetical protein
VKDKLDGVIRIKVGPVEPDPIKAVKGFLRFFDSKPWLRLSADVAGQLVEHYKKQLSETAAAKKEKTRQRRRDIYKAMCELDVIYSEEVLDLKKPSWKEYGEYLADEFNLFGYHDQPYKKRILQAIKKAGKEGRL